jgi:hypothetical protein
MIVPASEVRLVRPRHRGGSSRNGQFPLVLGADDLPPCFGAAPIGDGGRPRHCEGAFILDRELELQQLAPIGVVGCRARIGAERRATILPRVPFQSFFADFVVVERYRMLDYWV